MAQSSKATVDPFVSDAAAEAFVARASGTAVWAGFVAILCGAACAPDAAPAPPSEPWADRPVVEWPDLALTNDIEFGDTTYAGVANAFLVDTGSDTVAVTVKHVFLALARWRDGIDGIDPGSDFVAWRIRSSREPSREVAAELLNDDPDEPIGEFSSLKDRDWLVFSVDSVPPGVYPLKVRWTPLERDEVVRAVGRSRSNRESRDPTVFPLRRYQEVPGYYYVEPLNPGADPTDTSGSPVIDREGYLVGIVSGAVGRLGVVCGVDYLRRVFDRVGIPHAGGGGR